MFEYDPKDAVNTLLAGEYDASLEKFEDTTSKASGKPMLVLLFRVYGKYEALIPDRFVKATLWKLKQVARAFDKEAEFNEGQQWWEDCLNHALRVQVEVENDPKYGEQNKITGYSKLEGPRTTPKSNDIHADIPF